MTLKQKQILSLALLGIALLLMVLSSFVDGVPQSLGMVGVVLALAGLLANYWLVRFQTATHGWAAIPVSAAIPAVRRSITTQNNAIQGEN